LDGKIKRAEQGFAIQKQRTIQERAQLIKKLGDCIQERFKEATETVTFEMGKPISDSEGEINKAIRFCKHYS
jgi:acyl-CoA reductase-like NAD-dependent aldehyde dehydrogenase